MEIAANSLVSVIMPVFNAELYIRDSISSVLNQTYSNWELLVVDDCSTDDSFCLAASFAKRDKRIKLFKLESNKGSAAARNFGLIHSVGRYVCFLDSDDYYDSRFLEKQIAFLEKTGPFVFSSYCRLGKTTKTIFNVRKVLTVNDIIKGNDISCLTAFYDSQIVGKPLFDETLKMNEDFFYWVNILKITKSAYGNDECLATYRIVKKSKSKKKIKSAFIMFYIFRKKMNLPLFKSFISLFKMSVYSKRKYKDVQ